YELRHDALAAKIYEKITVVEKEVLEVRQFIEGAYDSNLKRGVLLSPEDLRYMAPYEDKLYLDKKVEAFIQESKAEAGKKKRRRQILFGTLITLFVVGISYYAYSSYQGKIEAEKQQEIAEEQGRKDKANYLASEALSIVDKDHTLAYLLAEKSLEYNVTSTAYKALFASYVKGPMVESTIKGQPYDEFYDFSKRIDPVKGEMYFYDRKAQEIGTLKYGSKIPDAVQILNDSTTVVTISYTDSTLTAYNVKNQEKEEIKVEGDLNNLVASLNKNVFRVTDGHSILFYNGEDLSLKAKYPYIDTVHNGFYEHHDNYLESNLGNVFYFTDKSGLRFVSDFGELLYSISFAQLRTEIGEYEKINIKDLENGGFILDAGNDKVIVVDLINLEHFSFDITKDHKVLGGRYGGEFYVDIAPNSTNEYQDFSEEICWIFDQNYNFKTKVKGTYVNTLNDGRVIIQVSKSFASSGRTQVYDQEFNLLKEFKGMSIMPYLIWPNIELVLKNDSLLVLRDSSYAALINFNTYQEVVLSDKAVAANFSGENIIVSENRNGVNRDLVFDLTGSLLNYKESTTRNDYSFGKSYTASGIIDVKSDVFQYSILSDIGWRLTKMKENYYGYSKGPIPKIYRVDETYKIDSSELKSKDQIQFGKTTNLLSIPNDLLLLKAYNYNRNHISYLKSLSFIKGDSVIKQLDLPFKAISESFGEDIYTVLSKDSIMLLDLNSLDIKVKRTFKSLENSVNENHSFIFGEFFIEKNINGFKILNVYTGEEVDVNFLDFSEKMFADFDPTSNSLAVATRSKLFFLNTNLELIKEVSIPNKLKLKVNKINFHGKGNFGIHLSNIITVKSGPSARVQGFKPNELINYKDFKVVSEFRGENINGNGIFMYENNTAIGVDPLNGIIYSNGDKSEWIINWDNFGFDALCYLQIGACFPLIPSEYSDYALKIFKENNVPIWFFPATPEELIRQVREDHFLGNIRDFTPEEKKKYGI
ncbi:MAG: flagellar basal body-associated protein FliL, partial [Flavobacteriales bacterium]